MAALREPLVRGETMAARPGNDADGRRRMPSRAGVLLRAMIWAAFAAGVWCLMGTANAFAGEHVVLRHAAPPVGTPAHVDTGVGPPPAVRRLVSLRPVVAALRAVEVSSVDAVPSVPLAGTVDALLGGVRDRAVPDRLLPYLAIPGTPGLVPWAGRASRSGPPREGLVPPGAGPAAPRSIVDIAAPVPPRTAPRPDPATFTEAGMPGATAPEPPQPAHPAHLAAVPRHSGTAALNPVRDSGGGIDKTPGLCALAHESPVPPAPPRSTWVASRAVPALCLRGSEPPVSPD